MRFLADMGVAQRVVEWLRAEGHDAAHLREESLQRTPNGEIFEKAALEGRVILTFDLDLRIDFQAAVLPGRRLFGPRISSTLFLIKGIM
jgi:predicted nuclease of predicted toxin-antitoxin system